MKSTFVLWLTDSSHKKHLGVTPLTALHLIAWCAAIFFLVVSTGNNYFLFLLLVFTNLTILVVRGIRKIARVVDYMNYSAQMRSKTRVVKTIVRRTSIKKRKNWIVTVAKASGQTILRLLVKLAGIATNN